MRRVLTGCLVVLFVLVAGALALVAGFPSGIITQRMIFNVMGLGPGDVEVDNFRDDTVQVSIQALDAAKGQRPSPTTLTVRPLNVTTYRIQQHGRFTASFTTAAGAGLGSCTFTLRSGDHYQFVPLAARVVVSRNNRSVSKGTDLIVGTSSLCR